MSKKIPLTQGQFAIVDDADYDWLTQWKWCAVWDGRTKSFYAERKENKHTVFMAREILGLKFGDKRQSDHIYHINLDNRRSELRIVTHQQNSFNSKNPKGYYWHKPNKKYQAKITLNGNTICLGSFLTAKDARNAYLTAKEIYHKI